MSVFVKNFSLTGGTGIQTSIQDKVGLLLHDLKRRAEERNCDYDDEHRLEF